MEPSEDVDAALRRERIKQRWNVSVMRAKDTMHKTKEKIASFADVVQAVAGFDRDGRIHLDFDDDDDKYDIASMQQHARDVQTQEKALEQPQRRVVPVMNVCIMIVDCNTAIVYFGFSAGDWDERRLVDLLKEVEKAAAAANVRVMFQTLEDAEGQESGDFALNDFKYKPLKYSVSHPPRYSLRQLEEKDPIAGAQVTLKITFDAPEMAETRVEGIGGDRKRGPLSATMNRARALRISVVDEASQSPRILDEETLWRPNAATTPLYELQSPSLPAGNGSARQPRSSPALQPALRHRRSASPKSRGDIVMHKIMNPHLDRETSSLGLTDDVTSAPPEDPATPSFVKASAFDDDYHSVYVPKYPKGLRGLVVLFQSPLLLMAIGLFSAFVGLFIDFWLAKIAEYHNLLTDWGFRYFLLSALVAASFSAALVHLVCPQATGSGLPFTKVAISGVDMSEYLSLRCIVVKIVGLIAAYAAGLSIGKEGPFIMISSGFANVLMNLSPFKRINNDETKRLEMLACACAAGVAATFGSPFGGVLFGVEVTSHFYMVRTLPRSFFAAIVGALLVNFVTQNSRYGLFGDSSLGISEVSDVHSLTIRDLVVFVAMGAACGLGGALFNLCISLLVRLRDRVLRDPARPSTPSSPTFLSRLPLALRPFWTSLTKRLLLVGAITFVSCVTEFYGDSAWFIRHGSPRRILGALFSRDKHPFTPFSHGANATTDEEQDSALLSRSLMTYLPLKFLLTLLSVVLPIPAGLFTPTFVIGGIFGRLVGEAIKAYDLLDTQYEPFEFAVIGAGAFSSGVTHAISTAVIIMEVSHSDGLNLPVSIAILASYFTAKRFTENVYDLLISTSNLPRLTKLPKAAYDIPSWEVMRDVKDMSFLTADSTYADALHVLRRSREPVFAIVDTSDNLFLLATVTRRRLEAAVLYCQTKMQQVANGPTDAETTPLVLASDAAGYGALELPPPNLLDWPIHFAFRRGGKIMEWGTNELCTRTKLTVLINPSPFQLMEMTPMKRVDLLFRMLKLNNAYITRSGRLVGVITRDRLMTFLGRTRKYRVPGLLTTLTGCCRRGEPAS
ncbi:hypothetical protein ATCC90586_007496 [Pythium insidiosum]|nr:hypothetical protein ATCC90586_007496 [Pythium insidiosum]